MPDALEIEGFLSLSEATLLSDCGAMANHCIVEIGSYRGRSTIALAQRATVPVYAIDPHEWFTAEDGHIFDGPMDREHFMRNLLSSGMAQRVRLVNLASIQAAASWQRPIDVLWIDGDHRAAAVRADLHAWLPFVVAGGQVLLHDYDTPGVMAARRELESAGDFEQLETVVMTAHYRRLHVRD
jgi:predicted O-methyltransferase YrrM